MQQQPIVVYAVIALFIVARFLMRELRERRLSTMQLFILPGVLGCVWLYLAFTAGTSARHDGLDLGVRTAIALAFGAIVGVLVARFTTVRIDGTGKVFFRGSYVTVAIWIGALVLRLIARFAFPVERGNASAALASGASLVLLAFVATTVVRVLVYRKASQERARGIAVTETAV